MDPITDHNDSSPTPPGENADAQIWATLTALTADADGQSIRPENADAVMDPIIEHFRQTRQAQALFEAIKWRARWQLGLPLVNIDPDATHDESTERAIESALLDACRQAGTMLIQDGEISQGWLYLRPTGDVQTARRLLSRLPVTDDNYDDLIGVLLYEGVDVPRGYRMLLDRQGTCNAITTFDQAIAARSLDERRAAAAILLDSFHAELTDAVKADLQRRETSFDAAAGLSAWLDRCPDLLAGGYHLDTTHVQSVTQIASILRDRGHVQKALDLAKYGCRLDAQFRYPGEEPFADFYPSFVRFYETLLERNVETNLAFFRRKAESADASQSGTAPLEVYLSLLLAVGQSDRAIREGIAMVPEETPPTQWTGTLIELADTAADRHATLYEPILRYCAQHHDLLGYAATIRHRDADQIGDSIA